MAFAPDGKELAVAFQGKGGYHLGMIDVATGQWLYEFDGVPFQSPINAMAFTPDLAMASSRR